MPLSSGIRRYTYAQLFVDVAPRPPSYLRLFIIIAVVRVAKLLQCVCSLTTRAPLSRMGTADICLPNSISLIIGELLEMGYIWIFLN